MNTRVREMEVSPNVERVDGIRVKTVSLSDSKKLSIVPENIKNDIHEKGFHMYEWIDNADMVKNLQLDFVSFLSKLSIPVAILVFITSIVAYLSALGWPDSTFLLPFFTKLFYTHILQWSMWILWPTYAIMLIVLLWKALTKSIKLWRGNFAVFTDDHINVWGKIVKYENYDSELSEEVDGIGKMFNEDFMKESDVSSKTSNAWLSIVDWFKEMFSGIGSFMKMLWDGWTSSSDIKVMIVVWLLSILAGLFVTISGGVMFLGWMLMLLLVSFPTAFINKMILKMRGNTSVKLNDNFLELDNISDRINKKSVEIKGFTKDASSEDWSDGLSLKMSESLKNFNADVKLSTESLAKLLKTIEWSEYEDIFNHSKYSTWVKKNLLKTINDMISLIGSQKRKLFNKIDEATKKIATSDNKPLTTQLETIEVSLRKDYETLESQEKQLQAYSSAIESNLR